MGKNRFKSIAGWEKFGDTVFLRLDLVAPELTAVWTGGPSIDEPQPEHRMLRQLVVPLTDVQRAVTEEEFAAEQGYGPGDVELMKKALEDRARQTAERREHTKPSAGLGLGL